MVDGVRLTLLIGPTVPVPAPKIVMDALRSIEIAVPAAGPSGFQLVLTLADRSPLNTLFLLTGSQPDPLVRVVIVVTIKSVPQVLIDGVLTHHNVAPGPAPGQSTLTFTGEDLTRVMDLEPKDGTTFPGMSPELRVLRILAAYGVYGIVPAIVPPLVPDVPDPARRIPQQ